MKVAVLGTGMVGRSLAEGLSRIGHTVLMGTRSPKETLARAEPDAMGNPPLRIWLQKKPFIELGSFSDAAAFGELIVNATNGGASLPALEAAGAANLDGKILVDVANPLDFSKGLPPKLFVSNSDSLAERIQRAFPGAKVVKTLNTVNASLMTNPRSLAAGDHGVFVSGNDAAAKNTVGEILRGLGWVDIVDLGDITTARGPEMYLPLWLRLWGALGTPMLNIKVVR